MKSDALEFQPQIITLLIVVLCYFINGPAYPFEGNLIWLPLWDVAMFFIIWF